MSNGVKSVSGVISGIKISNEDGDHKSPAKQKAVATPDELLKPRIHADIPQSRVKDMREKALKIDSIRIKPAPETPALEIDESFDQFFDLDEDALEEPQEDSTPAQVTLDVANKPDHRRAYIIGGAVTVLWFAFAHAYAISPASDISLSPMGIAAYLAGICTPLVLFWLVLTSITRGKDTQFYAHDARRQLHAMLFSSEDQNAHLTQNISALHSQRRDFEGFADGMNGKIAKSQKTLRSDLNDFREISIQAEARLDAMAQRLEERLSKLTEFTEIIEKKTVHIEGSSKASLKILDKTSETFLERYNQIEETVHRGVENVRAASDSALEQSQEIKENWQENSDILEANLERSSIRLDDMATRFGGYNDKFEHSIAALSNNAKQVEANLKSNVALSDHAALATQNKLRDAIETLRTQGAEADKISDDVAVKLDGAARALNNKINYLGTSVADVINEASTMVADLDQNLVVRQTSLQNTAMNIAQNAQKLDGASVALSEKAQDLESASTSLDSHTNMLKNKTTQHIASVQNTIDDLYAASEKAAIIVKDLQETDARTQRDNVISSSKFLIESLHSLSVDLSRMVHGYISEKMWKLYQRGDLETFTRELFKSGQGDLEAARHKYKEDGNFRTCANRYMRQFDDLYAQAAANDHGGLLSATFASSEVGRLYAVLCIISNKPNKAQKLSETII